MRKSLVVLALLSAITLPFAGAAAANASSTARPIYLSRNHPNAQRNAPGVPQLPQRIVSAN